MELITEQDCVKETLNYYEAFLGNNPHPPRGQHVGWWDGMHKTAVAISELPTTPTTFEALKGLGIQQTLKCSVCEKDVLAVVVLQENYGEGNTEDCTACLDCLKKAVALIEPTL